MSSAKKCDRCGKLFESSSAKDCVRAIMQTTGIYITEHGGTEVDLTISSGSKRIVTLCCGSMFLDLDLCPDCVESFKNWWANETVIPVTKKRGKKDEQINISK